MAGSKKRYRLVHDDDGHDYLIPANREEAFMSWVYAMEDGADTDADFSEYVLDSVLSMYTFTDWRSDNES